MGPSQNIAGICREKRRSDENQPITRGTDLT